MTNNYHDQYIALGQQFADNIPVLRAIGDETRQHIILCMFELPCRSQGGARVGEIAQKTNLSRASVFHHIKILKNAGIVGMRSEGTKNYYFLLGDKSSFDPLLKLFQNIIDFSQKFNERKNIKPAVVTEAGNIN